MILKKNQVLLLAVALSFFMPLEAAKKGKAKETTPKPTVEKAYFMSMPKSWQCIVDKSQLPAKVEMVYLGTGGGGLAPSVNVAKERTELNTADYIALAKRYHESEGDTHCRSLGTIETKEGTAEVLQIERRIGLGDVRFIQAALVKEGYAYVITATCLQKEFGQYSTDFFAAIRSFTITKPT